MSSGLSNTVSCRPVAIPPEPARCAYLIGRYHGFQVDVLPAVSLSPEESWKLAVHHKMHVVKVVCRDDKLFFESYLSNPDASGRAVDVITHGLASLLQVARCVFPLNKV